MDNSVNGRSSSTEDAVDSKDLEARKGPVTAQAYHDQEKIGVATNEEEHIRHGSVVEVLKSRHIQQAFAPLRYLRMGEEWLDAKLGVETRGVDRIPEEEKQPPSVINIFFFWWSLNVHIGVVPLGILGPSLFEMSLGSSIAALVVGTALGALCTGFNGTLGPKLGLRQIACSRYSFGYWGAMIASVLNIVIGGGFAVVNFVVVGQILSAVADYNLTITAGIIIIAVVSYLISVFGYKMIHTFEKYSWIYAFILLLVLVAQAAPHVDPSVPSSSSGLAFAGSFLSLLAIAFSNASGWCSIAADYYCNYPASTSPWLVFFLTWSGITVATSFSVIIGAVIGNAAVSAQYPPYLEAYTDHYFGGLLRTIYHPTGWSKFSLVLLMFSVLGNNVAIFYSTGLSLQLFGSYFLAVPRFIWSLIAAIVIAVLAIAGKEHLSDIIANFVNLLGYWTISFTIILLLEDRVFRRITGYNLQAWNQPSKLPVGAAAVLALLAGYLAGGVTGMSQTWYVGPIAKKFSEYGGDVGIWMSGAITLVVYPAARTVEKKLTGR